MEKIKNSDLKRFRFSVSTELTVFIAYVLIFIVFSIISPFFLSIKNITNIFLYSSVIGISAAGMTMVLLSGGLDISVGSIFGLSAITAGLTTNFTGSTTLGILAGKWYVNHKIKN
jgi:ribose transport system permease protein